MQPRPGRGSYGLRGGTGGRLPDLAHGAVTVDDRYLVLELAQEIISITGGKSKVEHIDPQGLFHGQFVEIPQRVPDVSLLNEAIGFAPSTPIKKMIDNFHGFYSKNINNPGPDSSFF